MCVALCVCQVCSFLVATHSKELLYNGGKQKTLLYNDIANDIKVAPQRALRSAELAIGVCVFLGLGESVATD